MPDFRGKNSRFLRLFVAVMLVVSVAFFFVWFSSEDSLSSKRGQCTFHGCTLWGHEGALKAPFTLETDYGVQYYTSPGCGALDVSGVMEELYSVVDGPPVGVDWSAKTASDLTDSGFATFSDWCDDWCQVPPQDLGFVSWDAATKTCYCSGEECLYKTISDIDAVLAGDVVYDAMNKSLLNYQGFSYDHTCWTYSAGGGCGNDPYYATDPVGEKCNKPCHYKVSYIGDKHGKHCSSRLKCWVNTLSKVVFGGDNHGHHHYACREFERCLPASGGECPDCYIKIDESSLLDPTRGIDVYTRGCGGIGGYRPGWCRAGVINYDSCVLTPVDHPSYSEECAALVEDLDGFYEPIPLSAALPSVYYRNPAIYDESVDEEEYNYLDLAGVGYWKGAAGDAGVFEVPPDDLWKVPPASDFPIDFDKHGMIVKYGDLNKSFSAIHSPVDEPSFLSRVNLIRALINGITGDEDGDGSNLTKTVTWIDEMGAEFTYDDISEMPPFRNMQEFWTDQRIHTDIWPSITGVYMPEERFSYSFGNHHTQKDPDLLGRPRDDVLMLDKHCIEKEDLVLGKVTEAQVPYLVNCMTDDYMDNLGNFCQYYHNAPDIHIDLKKYLKYSWKTSIDPSDGSSCWVRDYSNVAPNFFAVENWLPLAYKIDDNIVHGLTEYSMKNADLGEYGFAAPGDGNLRKYFRPASDFPQGWDSENIYKVSPSPTSSEINSAILMGRKFKMQQCLKLYVEEWAHRGDCGEIVLMGARPDIGESHCQWVAKSTQTTRMGLINGMLDFIDPALSLDSLKTALFSAGDAAVEDYRKNRPMWSEAYDFYNFENSSWVYVDTEPDITDSDNKGACKRPVIKGRGNGFDNSKDYGLGGEFPKGDQYEGYDFSKRGCPTVEGGSDNWPKELNECKVSLGAERINTLDLTYALVIPPGIKIDTVIIKTIADPIIEAINDTIGRPPLSGWLTTSPDSWLSIFMPNLGSVMPTIILGIPPSIYVGPAQDKPTQLELELSYLKYAENMNVFKEHMDKLKGIIGTDLKMEELLKGEPDPGGDPDADLGALDPEGEKYLKEAWPLETGGAPIFPQFRFRDGSIELEFGGILNYQYAILEALGIDLTDMSSLSPGDMFDNLTSEINAKGLDILKQGDWVDYFWPAADCFGGVPPIFRDNWEQTSEFDDGIFSDISDSIKNILDGELSGIAKTGGFKFKGSTEIYSFTPNFIAFFQGALHCEFDLPYNPYEEDALKSAILVRIPEFLNGGLINKPVYRRKDASDVPFDPSLYGNSRAEDDREINNEYNRNMILKGFMIERIRNGCGAFSHRGTWQQDPNGTLAEFMTGKKSRCEEWKGFYGKKYADPKMVSWRLPRFDYEFLRSFIECTGPFRAPKEPCKNLCDESYYADKITAAYTSGDPYSATIDIMLKGEDCVLPSHLFWAEQDTDTHLAEEEPFGFWCTCPSDKTKTTQCNENYCTCSQHVVVSGAFVPPMEPLTICKDYGPFRRWLKCFYQARAKACPVVTRDISASPINELAAIEKFQRMPDYVEPEGRICGLTRVEAWADDVDYNVDDIRTTPIRWTTEEPNILARLPVKFESGAFGYKHHDLVFQSQVHDIGPPYIEPMIPFPLETLDRDPGDNVVVSGLSINKDVDAMGGVLEIIDDDIGNIEIKLGRVYKEMSLSTPQTQGILEVAATEDVVRSYRDKYFKGLRAASHAFNLVNTSYYTEPDPSSPTALPSKYINPRAQEAIVGPRGCDIGGWYEMMLYQARCIKMFSLNCICDYEKTFLEGSAEAYVLKRGGTMFRAAKPYITYTGGENKHNHPATLIDDKHGWDTRIEEVSWPLMWRGYVGPDYPKNATSGSKLWDKDNDGKLDGVNAVGHLIDPYDKDAYVTLKLGELSWDVNDNRRFDVAAPASEGIPPRYYGLSEAQFGDFMILDETLNDSLGRDARYRRHVAFVEATNGIDRVVVSEWNYGKNQDSCGVTDRWKHKKYRAIFRDEDDLKILEKAKVPLVPLCDNPDMAQCYEPNWFRVKLYRPSLDTESLERPICRMYNYGGIPGYGDYIYEGGDPVAAGYYVPPVITNKYLDQKGYLTVPEVRKKIEDVNWTSHHIIVDNVLETVDPAAHMMLRNKPPWKRYRLGYHVYEEVADFHLNKSWKCEPPLELRESKMRGRASIHKIE